MISEKTSEIRFRIGFAEKISQLPDNPGTGNPGLFPGGTLHVIFQYSPKVGFPSEGIAVPFRERSLTFPELLSGFGAAFSPPADPVTPVNLVLVVDIGQGIRKIINPKLPLGFGYIRTIQVLPEVFNLVIIPGILSGKNARKVPFESVPAVDVKIICLLRLLREVSEDSPGQLPDKVPESDIAGLGEYPVLGGHNLLHIGEHAAVLSDNDLVQKKIISSLLSLHNSPADKGKYFQTV